jgi:hypothetical protein
MPQQGCFDDSNNPGDFSSMSSPLKKRKVDNNESLRDPMKRARWGMDPPEEKA